MDPVTLLPVRHDGWTCDELEDLPEDGLRYELVDGSLHVNPPPTNLHDYAAFRLAVLLDAALGEPWRVVPGGGIAFGPRDYRQPDLMVLMRAALDSRLASPVDVLLAVEVMSPSSLTEDRLVKPAQYAAAGIQHYWRLQCEDAPEFVTHELDGLVYREVGRFTDEVVVERPVALQFRLDDLLR